MRAYVSTFFRSLIVRVVFYLEVRALYQQTLHDVIQTRMRAFNGDVILLWTLLTYPMASLKASKMRAKLKNPLSKAIKISSSYA
jgi:hypothetical protein